MFHLLKNWATVDDLRHGQTRLRRSSLMVKWGFISVGVYFRGGLFPWGFISVGVYFLSKMKWDFFPWGFSATD